MLMSLSLRISPQALHGHHLGFNEYPTIVTIPRVCFPLPFSSRNLHYCPLNHSNFRSLCSINADSNADGFSDAGNYSANDEAVTGATCQGVEETEEIWNFWNFVIWATEHSLLPHNLPLGMAALHLLSRFYVAPVPGRMGYVAAVERFLKVLAMVWAGSQVTKLVRAAGALALAPLVDRGLSWFTVKFKFQTQGKASFHGNCRILLWTGCYTISCCDIALGMKATSISSHLPGWREPFSS
ncbi:hypothetical protein WN943_006854 [Citrus x changshan-huyou]